MGATLSHLGYASHQQYHNKRVPQQLHQGCGPIPILGKGDAASFSFIDLCTRLVALEKDLQISRADNSNKEVVIQYLLQSSVGSAGIKETTAQLKRQLLALKTTIDRTNEENEGIKEKLGKAEEAIIALSTPSVPTSGPQSTCTSFSSCTGPPAKTGAETEDLIDLLGCNQLSESAKLTEGDSTLLDEDFTDEPDIERLSQRANLHQALHQYSVSEVGGSSYFVHFADSEEDAKPQDIATLSKVQVCRGLSDSITTPPHQTNIRGLSETSDESSTEGAFPPSGPISTATSFSSTSIELSPPDDVHSKPNIKDLSQLEALDFDGGNLDISMAIVSKLTDKLPRFGTRTQAEPSRPTLQAPTEAQDTQTSIRGNTIEPRWSPESISHSAQDRKNAVLINKRSAQAGARDIYYPDLRYSIRYVPKDYEQDTYRTVAISGLSPSVTMKTLLEKVRGGMLVDAKLLDTAKLTGSNTALVTFLYERSAMEYEDHAKHHPIAFSNALARISVVPTPTWPMPVNLRSGIEKYGHTRCFEVHNVPRDVSLPVVRQGLTSSPVMKSDSLECMRLRVDGVLELRFSSIRAAAYSSALFSKTFRYQGCTVKCFPDPCAQPLETLLDQRTSEAVQEDTSEPAYNSDAKADADGGIGRLTKVDWNIEPELRRGRGFKDQTNTTNTTTNAINELAGHGILPSSVSTGEALRQETAASIASFANSFFPSK